MAEDIKSLGDLETVAASSDAIVEATIVREPKRDDFGRSYATGKRKDAIANRIGAYRRWKRRYAGIPKLAFQKCEASSCVFHRKRSVPRHPREPP